MRIINASPDRTIQLGYEGEDNVTKIIFRYDTEWTSHGSGVFSVRVLRHGERKAYNATRVEVDKDDMEVEMTVSELELSVRGAGEMQLVYVGAGFIKKSPIYRYNVSRAIDGVVDPPDGSIITSIIESLSELRDEIGLISSDDISARVKAVEDDKTISVETFEVVGIPTYVSDPTGYTSYGLTEPGWYSFAEIRPKSGTDVDAGAVSVEGAAGWYVEDSKVYAAVRFEVAAMSKPVTISWGSYTETIIFKATDLAVRNLDQRVTFYVYDADPFTTWEYAPTTDTKFVAGKKYFTLDGDEYTEAEVTAGDDVTEGYYVHSKVIISGLVRNVTYRLNEIVDCPMEFILPEIDDETHGAWYEIRCRHAGQYSMTLTPPEGVKIATEHTQKETAGINMINLHYTVIDGVKIWRFMNTHSTIPA